MRIQTIEIIDYKAFLRTHKINGVLKHFKYSLTGGKELGGLWAAAEETLAHPTGKKISNSQEEGGCECRH